MLFPDGLLNPDAPTDPRVRNALHAATSHPETVVRVADLLAWAAAADPELAGILAQSVRTGRSPTEYPVGRGSNPGVDGIDLRPRNQFCPETLAALDEFTAATGGAGGLLDTVGLEVLALTAVRHLPEEEVHGVWSALDPDVAVAKLTQAVVRGLDFAGLFRRAFAGLGASVTVDADADVVGRDDTGDEDDNPDDEDTEEDDLAGFGPIEDLTHRATRAVASGRPDPFAGDPVYDRMFDRLARSLCRDEPRHAALVGEPGVWPGVVLAETARRAAAGQLSGLSGRRFFLADARAVPADEARAWLAGVFARASGRADWVIGIEGLGALLGPAAGPGPKAVLAAALQAARCRVVLILAPGEAETFLSGDLDLADRTTRVDVPEPSLEAAIRLVGHAARGLEARYGVLVDDAAIRRAVALTADFMLGDRLPGKAVRILQTACEDQAYDRTQPGGVVGPDNIRAAVAAATGLPTETLEGVGDRTDYAAALGTVVAGQTHAVAAMAAELGLIRAGMTDRGKPASVLLFVGPTGTGKTELAKAVARLYAASGRLSVYPLGNCVEPHSVSTVIGVPPGYVGHDQGGRLINELLADPYGVFLLDEADKAHPDVLQPFLHLFDEGWVADQRGVRAAADRAIFILTTNVGQRMVADLAREGKSAAEIAERMKDALSQIRHGKSDRPVFSPEFLARVRRVVVFPPLDAAGMAGVARRQADRLAGDWRDRRGKRLAVPEGLVAYVGAAAHRLDARSGAKEGGRVVRKLVADWVEGPVRDALAADPDGYRAAGVVALEAEPLPELPESGPLPPPAVTVRFLAA